MSSLPVDYCVDVDDDVDMKPFTTNLHVSFIISDKDVYSMPLSDFIMQVAV